MPNPDAIILTCNSCGAHVDSDHAQCPCGAVVLPQVPVYATRILRRWIFNVTDGNDDVFCVGKDGGEIHPSDALVFTGTDSEAEAEAERRADAWEIKHNALCMRIERESRGKVM